MTTVPYWALPETEVTHGLMVDAGKGLTEKEAAHRLQANGENQLDHSEGLSPWKMLLSQFTDTMVLVLLGATVVSGLLGEMVDAAAIMAIVILNAVLGFVQEYRAERSLLAIQSLISQKALVLREGVKHRLEASQVVVGDVVILEAGDRVPADLRLLSGFSLMVDESILTGESFPVGKTPAAVAEDTILADRTDMAYMGTAVSRGRGTGVVVATGMNTAMGEIAAAIKNTSIEATPLQQRLDDLGKWLVTICIGICALVSVLGVLRGETILSMFMSGVSLAVAAIPEGLPAIVTVVLALGVTRMADRNAIVRRLPAVETLGCTTIICSDKTGTLTQNQMTVKRVLSGGILYDVEGEGYQPNGLIKPISGKNKADGRAELILMARAARCCNNAELVGEKGKYSLLGDPTEGALLVFSAKAGVKCRGNMVREVPFDSERKMMSVVMQEANGTMVYTKGALDMLLPKCRSYQIQGKNLPLNKMTVAEIMAWQNRLAEEAYRVLALAYREAPANHAALSDVQLEQDLVFLGLCAMIDPARREVRNSVRQCQQAGIIPVMITGDHPATAAAIAREIGLSTGEGVITGLDIDNMDDRELVEKAEKYRVFARVTPQHKYRIVKALKKKGHIVAMTGDGVNDAPAIKEADIGVAMGLSGTEVTREASDMILADDNFATIVAAVHEGRGIYDNIRKFLRYLLGCNLGEVMTMLLASLLALPIPMLPIQILWVNLITDGLPAMGLGVEPAEPGVMKRLPRSPRESIFARRLGPMITARGLYIGITTILVFWIGLMFLSPAGAPDLALARTMAFTHLVFTQMFFVFECRSEIFSPFELGFLKNRFLIAAVMVSVTMQLLAVYLPFFHQLLKTVPLSPLAWVVILTPAGGRFCYSWFKYTFRGWANYRWEYVKMD
ncbi:MAG: calcium-translocating P-type ATPase, SERCA-type [Methylocystaceae bacterium]